MTDYDSYKVINNLFYMLWETNPQFEIVKSAIFYAKFNYYPNLEVVLRQSRKVCLLVY